MSGQHTLRYKQFLQQQNRVSNFTRRLIGRYTAVLGLYSMTTCVPEGSNLKRGGMCHAFSVRPRVHVYGVWRVSGKKSDVSCLADGRYAHVA